LPEPIETDPHAATVLAKTLARQAAALHVVFMRGFADVLAKKERSLRDVGRALKAQNQCRIALRLLIALRAAEQSQKKSRNRTNRLLKEKIPPHDQALAKAPPQGRSWSTELCTQGVGLVPGTTSPTGRTHPCVEALEKVDGSTNRLGQGSLRRQCAQARPQKRISRRSARSVSFSATPPAPSPSPKCSSAPVYEAQQQDHYVSTMLTHE